MRGLFEGPGRYECRDESETRSLGRSLAEKLSAGHIVLLEGPLGAGKTTFVKGILEGLGWEEAVRSPTFNLLQSFETDPPVLHADLYRLPSAAGLGLEEYFETHLCLIEWPDRAAGLIDPKECWRVQLAFAGEGRQIRIEAPAATGR